jgi:multidrug efflux system outer membrane protein
MRYTPRFLVTLLVAGGFAGPARAQSGAAPGPIPMAPSGAEPEPRMPDVSDPMLVPVPPPLHQLTSWRQALVLVRQRSTALRFSQGQIENALGATQRALALALPQLSTTATLTRHLLFGTGTNFTPQGVKVNTTIPDPATFLTGSIDLRQPLINIAAWYGVGTAKDREQGAKLSSANTERTLLATAALAAVATITADRVADSSRGSLLGALSTLDLTERRAALGAASAVDVLRADQEVSLSRAQVVSTHESLLMARETLGAALGDTTAWGVSPNVQMDDLERTASTICQPVESIEARADIRSAAVAAAAAKRDRTAVDYLFVPTLDLISSVGYINYTPRSPNGEHFTWTVGGQLRWLLFDGGDRYGQQRQAEAAANGAEDTLIQAKRDATVQLTQADRAIAVAQTNLNVSLHARDLAQNFARLSRIAFVNGSGTSFDLVDSAKKLREAEIDLHVKEFGVLQARLTAYLGHANCSI